MLEIKTLQGRTWLTEYNDILTDLGWVHISKIYGAKYLLSVDEEGYVEKTKILEVNEIPEYTGTIQFRKAPDLYLSAKNLIFFKDCIWRVGDCFKLPEFRKKDYSGVLYNIVTENNTVISRSCTEKLFHNDDYIVSLCLAK
jgi:hypothetical protein